MSEQREKSVATKFMFPLKDADNRPELFSGTAWGALTNSSIICLSWSDSLIPSMYTWDTEPVPTEIGTTGEWYISVTAVDMAPGAGDHDYMLIKLDADEIDPQTILVDLKAGTLLAIIDTLQSSATAIKAKTDNLPADPASETNVTAVGSAVVSVGTKVDTVDGIVDAIKLKTDLIPASPATTGNVSAVEAKVDTLQSSATAIKAKTDNLTYDVSNNVYSIPKAKDATIGLSTQEKADVLVESKKAIFTETVPELEDITDVPVEPTIAQINMLQYMERRNGLKTTGILHQIFNGDGEVILEQDITDGETESTADQLRDPA